MQLRPLIFLFTLAAVACSAALAMAESPYTPDLAEFDGSNSIIVDPTPALALEGGSTIEFWAAADWSQDPGYDPVVLSNASPEGVSYLVALLRDRQGLGIMSGNDEALVAFDFTDGALHYVAITDYGDTTLVFIDNQLMGRFDFTLATYPSSGLFIGSADGQIAAFTGALAGLRLWDVAVSQQNLAAYAMRPVYEDDQNAHPDLEYLLGFSDFKNRRFMVVTDPDEAAAETGDE